MKKTILITGVSKGIGHALAIQFLKAGHQVIGTSRSGSIPNISNKTFKSLSLDLSQSKSKHTVTKYLAKNQLKIDLLINNAGIGPDLNFAEPEENSFQQTFEVNTTGTVFFTESCIPFLKAGGKIINISSKMGAIGPCLKTNATAYRMSKAALNMYSKTLANRLLNKVTVATVHPGWVRTTISNTNGNAPYSPKESAAEIIDFIQSDFKTGIFWNVETRAEMPW